MDRRSWLWRRKSSEKSPGETESSGSVSSHSERYSDDQEASRASPISTSPNHAQSPDHSYKDTSYEVHDATKSLNEKLSAALLSIGAKEDLVKQHAKVAEEAVAGWEKAENEVAALKQQLEATAQKNSALEDRIGHLDGALKECVRQLRQSREEQEQKLHVALVKKTNEWEFNKFELETRLTELQAQLEARNAEATTSIDHNLRLKLKALEKENLALRTELLIQSEDLQMKTLERELSTRAAETASKQHLESIKKVARLETECRRLRAAGRKSSPSNDHKPFPNLVCVESITDCQSDSGEQLFGVDNEPSCSDSWASALIAELDQFKNDKVLTRNLTASSIEIDLMDDFLEMERLAALPEADHGNSSFELDADSDHAITRENPLKAELEALRQKMGELEEKGERMAIEKGEVEMVLAETRNQLKISRDQLIITEDKLVELQWQLNSANGSKHVFKMEVEAIESRRKELGSQLESANLEVEKLREKVGLLERKSAEYAAKCQNIEVMEVKRKELEDQFESAHLEVEKLREKVGLLEGKLEEERTLSAKFQAKCRNMEAIEVERKELESQFMLAHMEAEELRAKMSLLEGKLREERALSVEFTAKVEALEANRKALSSQLGSANLEAGKLREKMGLLEKEVEVERALSSELAAKCRNLEAMETKREELESQLSSARLEVGELCEKVSLLEGKVEEERALQSQLEWAHLEVGRLCEKMGLLEKEVEEERALSAELGAKCQSLEDELVRKRREVEFRQPVSSNGELKIKQERELAVAAGKLAACQKSIASLSQQLKSLATFEDFMVEAEKPELDDKENLSGSSTLQNCDGRGVTPTSPSSSLPRFVKLLSPSRSYSHVKNQ